MIPYSRQQITDSDIAAVVSALRDDILTGGDKVGEFEEAIARYVGVKHVVAMNSATSALHVALSSAWSERGRRGRNDAHHVCGDGKCGANGGSGG